MKMYVKSLNGQVFAVDTIPQYMAGYEVVSRETFVQWCEKNGFTPREMGDDRD